jgi:hypothetical protein
MAEHQSWSVKQRIVTATVIAGTLDVGMASLEAASSGRPVASMLTTVASGPFPGAPSWGLVGVILGLVVHYAIMTVMVTVFVQARDRIALIRRHPLLMSAIYGIGLWLVMYGVVLQLRFGVPFPKQDQYAIAKQLFAHVVLVGLTIGLVTRKE